MPRRDNEYQRLVSLIHKTLAPTGAIVSDSPMVAVDGLSTPREVDILVDGEFGPYRLKVAIEVADDSRKFGIEDFDSYVTKYRGECRILVDKFVIVARRGFTKGVIEKATKLDVELLTITEAMEMDWNALRPAKLTVSMPPRVCGITFEPRIELQDYSDFLINARMTCPHGHDHGTPREHSRRLLRQVLIHELSEYKAAENQARTSPSGVVHLNAEAPYPKWTIRYKGAEFGVTTMKVSIHVAAGTSTVECTDYDIASSRGEKKRVRHLQSTVAGQRLSWILTGERRQSKIIMNIQSAKSAKNTPKTSIDRSVKNKDRTTKRAQKKRARQDRKRNSR